MVVLKQAAEVAALPWNEWQLSRGMGGRLRLESVAAHQRSVKALQEALLKSLEWNEAVLTGQVDSFEALIRRDNLNPRQTHRLRKLALLALYAIQCSLNSRMQKARKLQAFA